MPLWFPSYDDAFLRDRTEQAYAELAAWIAAHPLPPIQKRHHTKAYEAPYVFPRDLEEALDDLCSAVIGAYAFDTLDEQDERAAETIKQQIVAYVRSLSVEVRKVYELTTEPRRSN